MERAKPKPGDTGERMSRRRMPGVAFRYGAALLLVGIAWGVREVLDPYLGELQPFAIFFAPVLLMAWWAGWGPSAVAAVLGLLLGDWFFCPPRGRLLGGGPSELTAAIVYVAVSLALILVTQQMRRARQRLEREIEERKINEEVLRKQARLIDLAPAATITRSLDGLIRFWSEGAERLYGWTREEAVGRRTHDLLKTEFLEQPLEAIVSELRRGGKWTGELRHTTKSGKLVIVESHWLGQFTPNGEVAELLESNMDITERKQAEEELRGMKDELEIRVQQRTAELAAANKELEAFSYSASHDLRAPLRHIDSYVSLLQRSAGPTLDEKNRAYLRTVSEAAKRMGQLIDDLLVLGRLGRATMEERTVDLTQLVEEARQELAPATAGRTIEWRVSPLPTVRGDSNLLRSVISNLLSNAIKYTRGKDPAQIVVGSRRQDGEVVCYVADNGAGFDMRFVDKLFGVFQRLHNPQEFEGTGIGLASVRRVIQRHGGRTWAESEVGKGATFYFSIPENRVVQTAMQRAA